MTGENVGRGWVAGAPRVWLRCEALLVLVGATAIYQWTGHSWLLFALLFLVPDVSFVGYLAGARPGAWAYNVAHSYAGPLLLAGWAVATRHSAAVALIWAAHVAFDRVLGYGLKYPDGFRHTHLGMIGRDR